MSAREIIQLRPDSIHQTPEYWEIYNYPNADSEQWKQLVASIMDVGIHTPLEVSADNYIISGHRRHLAALALKLARVPVLVDSLTFIGPMPRDERVKLLAERNAGIRDKTHKERFIEAAVMIDPEAALAEAEKARLEVFTMVKSAEAERMTATGSLRRTDPSGERAALLTTVMEIIEEKRKAGYLPTSGRSIHYQLLARKVLTSTRSSGYIYGTRPGSADLLSKLITDARSAGLIDHDDIDDSTRPSCEWRPSGSVGTFMRENIKHLGRGFYADVHADQPAHVEILLEKNTLFSMVKKYVSYPLRLPLTCLRGYGSQPAARDVARRFRASGKPALRVCYISDLDPEGVNMPDSWKGYLLKDFKIDADVYRSAITPAQVAKYSLPPDADVKLTSSRAKKFIAQHGEKVWELDGMPEKDLIHEVKTACVSMLDVDALNRGFAEQRKADLYLANWRARAERKLIELLQDEEAA